MLEKPDEIAVKYLKGLQNLAEKKKEEDLKTFAAAMRAKSAHQKRLAGRKTMPRKRSSVP